MENLKILLDACIELGVDVQREVSKSEKKVSLVYLQYGGFIRQSAKIVEDLSDESIGVVVTTKNLLTGLVYRGLIPYLPEPEELAECLKLEVLDVLKRIADNVNDLAKCLFEVKQTLADCGFYLYSAEENCLSAEYVQEGEKNKYTLTADMGVKNGVYVLNGIFTCLCGNESAMTPFALDISPNFRNDFSAKIERVKEMTDLKFAKVGEQS